MRVKRHKLLFVHQGFRTPGGGNMLAAWMLQALVDDYDVTTLTVEPEDFHVTDRHCGTSLSRSRFRSRVLPGRS